MYAAGDVDESQHAEDVCLHKCLDDMQHQDRDRGQETRHEQDQQRCHFQTHHVAKQTHRQSDSARDLTDQIEWQQDGAGREEMTKIVLQALDAVAETRKAGAAVADRSRVGECAPGIRPVRLAITRKTQSVPTKGKIRWLC